MILTCWQNTPAAHWREELLAPAGGAVAGFGLNSGGAINVSTLGRWCLVDLLCAVRNPMKRALSRALSFAAFALALCSLGGDARADAAGDGVLRKVDAALHRFKTLKLDYQLVTRTPPAKGKRMQLSAYLKGDKQLIEVVGASKSAGTRVLRLADDKVFVYAAKAGAARSLTASELGGPLLGSAYSARDLGLTRYAPMFTAKLISEDKGTWKLLLKAKPGAQAPYAQIELIADKTNHMPLRLKYFDAQGEHLKTETRSRYRCEAQVCLPGRQRMVDHSQDGRQSKLVLRSHELNPSLPDKLFAQSNLKR